MIGLSKAQRDEEFTRFAEGAQQSLTGTAWLLTGNREVAADLVQAALVKVYVAWPKVRRSDALAYARRTLVNENIDRWRARHDELVDDAPGEAQRTGDGSSAVDDRDEVARLLQRLPEAQRRVLVLRYFCDMSERDIAETLGISTGAVKSAASRGLAALRETSREGALA